MIYDHEEVQNDEDEKFGSHRNLLLPVQTTHRMSEMNDVRSIVETNSVLVNRNRIYPHHLTLW
jgi:hypothetical protein